MEVLIYPFYMDESTNITVYN